MAKFSNKILEFAGSNVDVYKKFVDYFNHYKATYHKSKVPFDTSVSLTEKEDKLNEALLCEIKRISGVTNESLSPEVFSTNPSVVWATFAVVGAMVDVVLPDSLIETTGIYTEQKNIDFGDSAAFTVKPRDLFVVSKHGRGRRMTEMKKQFDGQVTILPELREITVQVALYRVLSKQESLAEFVMKAILSIEVEITRDVYTAFADAMDNLPNTPGNQALQATGYSYSTLIEFAQKVAAWNGGAKPVIVGTALALSSILPDDANYQYSLDSEYAKLGYVRTLGGYDTMVLPQVADWKNPYAMGLNDKKIYIVSPASQKLVKLVLEGATLNNTNGAFNAADLTQSTTLFKSWGVGIATNSIAAQITLA